jgi:hypothetical protein
MDYGMGEKGRGRKGVAGEATLLERLGFVPDAWQARVLESESKRVLLNCTRQCGKSTVTAVKAVEQAYTVAESLTLVVSPSARQSGEFLRKAARLARKLEVSRKGDGDNEMSLLFPNGSRIVGLPGNEGTIRGFSAVNLLLVDEASRVPDELYTAVRPMLVVSEGALWLMSTPNGKRGFFWEEWERGGPEWEKVQVTAYECPRIGREALEQERETMGERNFRQEYLCEFGETEDGVFRHDEVMGAIDPTIEPWPWTEEGGVFA